MSGLFSRILAAVDGSEPAKVAVAVAARLAREHGGKLVLSYCANWRPLIAQFESTGSIIDPTPTIDAMKERGAKLLAEAAQIAQRFGVDARCRATQGEPASHILSLARETGSRLIVMGTHDGAGIQRLLIGSTTNAVLRRSTIPVLTVRPGIRIAAETRRCFERVLVATDDSESSAVAIDTALALPPDDRRELLFCSVADVDRVSAASDFEEPLLGSRLAAQAQTIVDRALDKARARGIVAEGRVLEGRPGTALIAAAEREYFDLIVLGTHGRRGIDRILLGSVAERVIRTALLPVMIVRTTASTVFGTTAEARHEAATLV
jgi:nucleotide-binding universal stress UspA family protein